MVNFYPIPDGLTPEVFKQLNEDRLLLNREVGKIFVPESHSIWEKLIKHTTKLYNAQDIPDDKWEQSLENVGKPGYPVVIEWFGLKTVIETREELKPGYMAVEYIL